MSPGWGDRQDRRDRQDYPTKHAHRNLVHPGAIEPQAADPCKVYLITRHVEHNDSLIWLPSECLLGCPFIASMPMQLSLDPDVADLAPTDPALARYDEEHLVTYLRMLDANEQGADWREVSRGTDRVPGGSGAPGALYTERPRLRSFSVRQGWRLWYAIDGRSSEPHSHPRTE